MNAFSGETAGLGDESPTNIHKGFAVINVVVVIFVDVESVCTCVYTCIEIA